MTLKPLERTWAVTNASVLGSSSATSTTVSSFCDICSLCSSGTRPRYSNHSAFVGQAEHEVSPRKRTSHRTGSQARRRTCAAQAFNQHHHYPRLGVAVKGQLKDPSPHRLDLDLYQARPRAAPCPGQFDEPRAGCGMTHRPIAVRHRACASTSPTWRYALSQRGEDLPPPSMARSIFSPAL